MSKNQRVKIGEADSKTAVSDFLCNKNFVSNDIVPLYTDAIFCKQTPAVRLRPEERPRGPVPGEARTAGISPTHRIHC